MVFSRNGAPKTWRSPYFAAEKTSQFRVSFAPRWPATPTATLRTWRPSRDCDPEGTLFAAREVGDREPVTEEERWVLSLPLVGDVKVESTISHLALMWVFFFRRRKNVGKNEEMTEDDIFCSSSYEDGRKENLMWQTLKSIFPNVTRNRWYTKINRLEIGDFLLASKAHWFICKRTMCGCKVRWLWLIWLDIVMM